MHKSLHSLLLFLCVGYLNAQVSDFDHIDFKKADRITLSYDKEGLRNLPQLAHKLTADLTTDVERFRAIYRWVCANIANDYGLYLKNNRKRQRFKDDSLKLDVWNTKFRQKLFKKLLKKKRTICTGYAYLVKSLADFANIECEIVQGYGRVSTTNIETLDLPNHSWNAVKLNGKWYLCDPTWASGIPNPKTNRFYFNYNDGFFLADPRLFAVNHFPIDSKWWLLEDNIPSFNDFLGAPVIYGNAYKHLELHEAPLQMHHNIKKDESVSFKYELKAPIKKETIKLLLDNGFGTRKTPPSSISIDNTTLELEHLFDKTGFYDIHFYIGSDLISTYTVEVSK
ncbi:transglutaminase domain-containing protein [Winogradskyella sp.]|uniref:transglutaminase domain-containing protein n=1 Tax=Winogradskyella sp. TaxID=1883156 RepID=UPI003BA9CA8F